MLCEEPSQILIEEENKSDDTSYESALRDSGLTRPKTRGDCIDGPRPCPWVSCKYHLGIDVIPREKRKQVRGQWRSRREGYYERGLRVNQKNIDGSLPSCALDCSDKINTFTELGRILGVSRQRAEQEYRKVEKRAQQKLLPILEDYGIVLKKRKEK